MYEVSEGFMTFLSVTATLSTIGLFLCGIQICSRIRQRGTTEGTAVAPFLVTSISCICWLGYGVLKEDFTVIFVNGVGLLVQSIYLVYYYSKTRLRNRLNKLITLELAVGIWTFWFVRSEAETKETVLGIICMFLNIASIGSPLLDVGQVIKTKSTESVPFMLCAATWSSLYSGYSTVFW
uniref:Sugar transporter SWEET1 n=1 Tax=Ditylenchus dipsaci TaxID=166011 RepID=A0A915CWV6_9BILA